MIAVELRAVQNRAPEVRAVGTRVSLRSTVC
jgi:hypothetical protein